MRLSCFKCNFQLIYRNAKKAILIQCYTARNFKWWNGHFIINMSGFINYNHIYSHSYFQFFFPFLHMFIEILWRCHLTCYTCVFWGFSGFTKVRKKPPPQIKIYIKSLNSQGQRRQAMYHQNCLKSRQGTKNASQLHMPHGSQLYKSSAPLCSSPIGWRSISCNLSLWYVKEGGFALKMPLGE